jgi:hypothetical protein
MSKSDDIIGYTYAADQYCPDHITVVMSLSHEAPPSIGTEFLLDAAAEARGINRQDEATFDSGDFPKVIFAGSVHDVCRASEGYEPGQCGDECATCGEPLGGPCPNTRPEPELDDLDPQDARALDAGGE